MKTRNNVFNKALIAFSVIAITFAACKKSDTEISRATIGSATDPQTTTVTDNSAAMARTGNQSPRAKAGTDQTIILPATLSLDGSGSSDADGSIVLYQWIKEIGPDAALTSATSAQTTVTGLIAGDYRFKLSVTDNKGATGTDTLHITVSGTGTPGNQAPVVNPGSAQTITLPVSSVTISGSATDADGTIASYLWTKTSGTGGTITNANSASTTVTGLTAGSYVFNLQATDNGGASGNKTVSVTVSSTTPPPANQAPVVNAGLAQTITLPASSVTLSGSATDADGTIASYLWTIVSGTGGTITNANTASTSVTGLTAGAYVFNLKATDNGGAIGNKTVSITVNSAIIPSPAGYTLLYSNGYNSSSDINSNQLGRGSISTSVFKSGTGSFKSVVNAGDGQISGGWRSEQQYGENLSPTGTEIAVEYDELFETLPNVAGLSVQWHGNTSGTSGQMSMWTQGGKFMVQRNTTGTAGSPNIYQSGTLKTIQTNTWYHLRWEIKYSSGSDGYVRVYIDNVLYYSITGKTSDGSGQYLKIGQNLFASPGNNSILYIDNLNVWKK